MIGHEHRQLIGRLPTQRHAMRATILGSVRRQLERNNAPSSMFVHLGFGLFPGETGDFASSAGREQHEPSKRLRVRIERL
jgi:hypothetical protein